MERLTVSEVFSGTMDTLQANGRTVGLFVGGMTAIGTALEWGFGLLALNGDMFSDMSGGVLAMLGVGAGLGGLAVIIVSIYLSFRLWAAMLTGGDLLAGDIDNSKLLPFVGLSILTGLGVGLGLILLVVPGLLFAARWSAAPAFLLRQNVGVTDSMGRSWDMIKGNSTPIILASIIVGVIVVVVSGISGGLNTFSANAMAPTSFIASLVNQLIGNTVTALQVGAGVFVFHRLSGDTNDVGSVFE
jgi:hypothetical protein